MEREWILVVDSGIGGLWTLQKIKEVLPNENYIYFMDKLHAPYGNKPVAELKHIAKNNLKKLIQKFNIKIIVLACNTLSSTCHDYLQKKFSKVKIVKIEPFFEPIIFGEKNTLVLATSNTIKRNQNLKKYIGYKNIFLHGFGTLAKKIDDAKGEYNQLLPYLKKSLGVYKKFHIQNVVLGCTHFNYIKPQIQSIFGKVEFFENSENIANFIKKLNFSLKIKQKPTNNCKKKPKIGKTLVLYKI